MDKSKLYELRRNKVLRERAEYDRLNSPYNPLIKRINQRDDSRYVPKGKRSSSNKRRKAQEKRTAELVEIEMARYLARKAGRSV